MTSRGPDRQKFADVRKRAGWLAEWFGRETGWTVHVDHSVARLRKVAASHQDGTRSAQVSKQPFSRRRYVLVCLALATLERAESQVTLGWLAERIVRLAREDELAATGISFSLLTREERSDLVAVARLMLDIGVLARVAGDEQAFGQRIRRRALRRGPFGTGGAADRAPRAIDNHRQHARRSADHPRRGGEPGHGRQPEPRAPALAGSSALDDPVVYYADLTDDERGYLERQRGPLLKRLTDATGLIAEVRAEGIALLDPTAGGHRSRHAGGGHRRSCHAATR